MTEVEWRDLDDLFKHWLAFCDADPFDGSDTFAERMEARGWIRLRSVRKSDIQNDPFAAERGIITGGNLWDLTRKGHAAFDEMERSRKRRALSKG
jgi:hypothetical protein